ncbi:MAG: hypothetical protein WAK04_08420 [Xanthobacteraceae bacterium]
MKPDITARTATELALNDLLAAAEDLFAVRSNMTQITIERRGAGAAWVKVDGHCLTTMAQWLRRQQ